MLENWKISPHQFKILVVMCFIGTSILLTPGALAAESKQDAWIAAIVGGATGMALVFFYNSLGNLFGNMTLIGYTEKLLGKWLGKAVSLSFIFFLFIDCSALLYVVGDFVTTQIMPETPIQFTYILVVIVVVMGTRLGLETFARTSEILYPWVIGFFIVLILFLLPGIEIKNIQPVFEHGVKATLRGALLYMSYSSLTLIILLMIFPACVNNQKEAKKSFLSGALIGSILVVIITFISILVLGCDFTARSTFPTYTLAKKISLANFLERVEAVVAVLWIITIFYKILLYFYGAVLGLTQTLGLKDHRPLTLPLGMILIVLSLIGSPNSTYAHTWSVTTWVSFALTFGLFLPLLLFIIALFRK